jgi:hypothetical protein
MTCVLVLLCLCVLVDRNRRRPDFYAKTWQVQGKLKKASDNQTELYKRLFINAINFNQADETKSESKRANVYLFY